MKKGLILVAVIFLLLMGLLFYAEFGASTPTASTLQEGAHSEAQTAATTEAKSAETEIRRILERYYEIARSGDREALKNYSREICAPEYQYSSELGVMDKAAALRYLDALEVKFVSAGFENLSVQIHGHDTAIAKYLDTSSVETNGVVMRKPMRFTNVWVKQNGGWKIVAEHSSLAAPPDLLPRNRSADTLARK